MKAVKDQPYKAGFDLYMMYVRLHIQLFGFGCIWPTGLPPSTIWDVCSVFSMALVLWL